MTKEELKQEAENYVMGTKAKDAIQKQIPYFVFAQMMYLAGAEPREKQIDELTEQNTSLLTSVENLNKSVQELEAQIEKMKCCSMCKYYSMSFLPYYCTKNNTAPHCTSKCDKWEIREK